MDKRDNLDWRDRSSVAGDVVSFRYTEPSIESGFEEVFVWDVDKTYLDTRWASLGDLWRTVMERAFQKKNVPGTGTLLRSLADDWKTLRRESVFPVYFITASPPQMESRIREKLELDDVHPVGMFFKDNLRNLRPGRLWRLTKQIGYKIQALLQLRLHLRPSVRQILWGDDSESDAIIYSIYSDICARRMTDRALQDLLGQLQVTGEQLDVILDLQERIEPSDPVEKIYINLATDTDPEYYLKFGRRLFPSVDAFQTGLDLFQDRRLGLESLLSVARDLRLNYGFERERFEAGLDDLIRRQVLGLEALNELRQPLEQAGFLAAGWEPSIDPRPIIEKRASTVLRLDGVHEPWVPSAIDYLVEHR
jgi:hypothetical protein